MQRPVLHPSSGPYFPDTRFVLVTASLLEGGGSVFEELLLPAVEYGWLESRLVTQVRDQHSFRQMPPQNGDLLFWRVVLPLLFHVVAPLLYPNGRTLSPFPVEPGQPEPS